jgi:shikimate kinase
MASGKTTVGHLLASRLGYPFVDTDRIIEAEQKQTVAEIFAAHGETHFRRLERETVARIAGHAEATVIGLGGGALLDPVSRKALLAAGTVVWLEAKPETILERAGGEPGQRPLLEGLPTREARLEKIRSLLESRTSAYGESHLRVTTDGKAPGAVVDEVLELLRSAGVIKA